jgi:hypothetical protein
LRFLVFVLVMTGMMIWGFALLVAYLAATYP